MRRFLSGLLVCLCLLGVSGIVRAERLDEKQARAPIIITQLKSGTVLLRYKETDTTQAGQVASITIPEHQSNTDGDGDGGKSEGLV